MKPSKRRTQRAQRAAEGAEATALSAVLCALCVCSFLIVSAPSAAQAQDKSDHTLKVEAQIAFGLDDVPPGWVPVRVTATRLKPGQSGDRFRFKLLAKHRWGENVRMAAHREETIPVGATKRFWLYVHAEEDGVQLEIEAKSIETGNDATKKLENETVNIRTPGNPYNNWSSNRQGGEPFRIASIGGRAGALNAVKSLTLQQTQLAPVPVRLEGDDIPDRRCGFAPFDLVVLNDAKLDLLSPEQRDALRSWVFSGGRLLLSPGVDGSWLQQPFFQDLLPEGTVEIESRRVLMGQPVAAYPALIYRPKKSERSLEEGAALQRFRAGRGEVAVIPYDISGGMLRDAPEQARTAFWNWVLGGYRPRSAQSAPDQNPWGGYQQQARVESSTHDLLVPESEAPVIWIAALSLLYVAAIGPANFLLLRRARREPLIVLTIPAIALASLGAIFVIGYIWKGTRAYGYEVTRIHAKAGERYALEERLMAFVPARQTTMEVKLGHGEDGYAVSTLSGDAADKGYSIDQRADMAIQDLRISRWEAGVVRGEMLRDLDGAIRVERTEAGGAIVRNETGLELKRVALKTATGTLTGGPVLPGKSLVLAPLAPEPDPADGAVAERRAWRGSLEGRAWYRSALPWLNRQQTPWALAAEVRSGLFASDRSPEPDERVTLLFVEP